MLGEAGPVKLEVDSGSTTFSGGRGSSHPAPLTNDNSMRHVPNWVVMLNDFNFPRSFASLF